MNYTSPLVRPEQIEQAILLIRGQRVMLDRDLAALYGVQTKNLNKAVRRNLDRFPSDFMLQLTTEESETLRFQFGTLKRGQHSKFPAQVFTQEGVAMLSSVFRSPHAVHSLSASTGERVRVRCRFEAANRLSRHSQGRCRSGQSESKTHMKPLTHHQLSTFNHQLPQTKPAGKWIERFEEWLADGGFMKKP